MNITTTLTAGNSALTISDSVLSLVTLLSQPGSPGVGSGDMTVATYDPQAIEDDAFARANHTGEQAIATITGLQVALYKAYIEIYLDQDSTTTRSIPSEDINTDLDFVLTYISDFASDFSYNDTTKELTYIGSISIIVRIAFDISMERTNTGGAPEMEYFVQYDSGSGFVKIPKSIAVRSYSNADIGTAGNSFLLSIDTGDKLKMGLRANAAIALDYRNITIVITAEGIV